MSPRSYIYIIALDSYRGGYSSLAIAIKKLALSPGPYMTSTHYDHDACYHANGLKLNYSACHPVSVAIVLPSILYHAGWVTDDHRHAEPHCSMLLTWCKFGIKAAR